LLTIREYKYID